MLFQTSKNTTPTFNKQLTRITLTIFLAAVVATAIQFSSLPSSVPIIQSFGGKSAQFGPKIAIFYLPFVAFMLFLLLHYLEMKAAHPVRRKNAKPFTIEQVKHAMLIFNLIKNCILLYFSFSLWNDLKIVKGENSILGQWHAYGLLVGLSCILLFGAVRGYFLRK